MESEGKDRKEGDELDLALSALRDCDTDFSKIFTVNNFYLIVSHKRNCSITNKRMFGLLVNLYLLIIFINIVRIIFNFFRMLKTLQTTENHFLQI